MQHTVIGIFRTLDEARRAAEQLRSVGFSESHVDLASSSADVTASGQNDTPYGVSDESRYNEKTSGTSPRKDVLNEDRIDARKEHDANEGDSIGRFFRNLFDNKDDAERYSTAGRTNTIVSVHAVSNEEAVRAADILDECGALDVDERSLDSGAYSRTQSSAGIDSDIRDRSEPDGITDDSDTKTSIPVIEENIHVGKREVKEGGVRVRARIVEKPVEEHLRLREEHIYVERTPANRPATESDLASFQEGELELTETKEVPMVNKEARVVEDIHLNKEVENRDVEIRESVRKTDINIEDLSDSDRTQSSRKDLD